VTYDLNILNINCATDTKFYLSGNIVRIHLRTLSTEKMATENEESLYDR